MAIGALDANGVWQYGEDDEVSPWSGPGGYMNKLAASISTILGGYNAPWQAYTPVLTVDVGSNPTNYTAAGRYKRIGRMYHVQWQIACGASFTPGTGLYRVSLPLNTFIFGMTNGRARGYDQSTGNAHLDLRTSVSSATTLALQYTSSHGGPLGNVGATVPWTWAPGDVLDGYATCEVA